jgi:hypothetical protein
MDEPAYARALNAVAPLAMDNRCLRGDDILTTPNGWALAEPYAFAAPIEATREEVVQPLLPGLLGRIG